MSTVGASDANANIKLIWARTDADVWGTYHNGWLKSTYSVYGSWRILMMVGSTGNGVDFYTDANAVENMTGVPYNDAFDRRAIGWGNAADATADFKGLVCEIVGLSVQIGATPRAALRSRLNTTWAAY
jgi:hypothetical protein